MEERKGRDSSFDLLETLAIGIGLVVAVVVFFILVYGAVLAAIGAAIWFGHKLGSYSPSEHDAILREIKRLNWAQNYHVSQLTDGKDEAELDAEEQQILARAK